jgi:hypothetical protein
MSFSDWVAFSGITDPREHFSLLWLWSCFCQGQG